MATWILGVSLGAAVAVAAALALSLRRARGAAKATDRLVADARAAVRDAVAAETQAHTDEIRRVLSLERAETATVLAAEERRLSEERRLAFAERERQRSDALADELARTERRLDERLRGFTDDLERAQRHLEAQLAHLVQRYRQAIADVESRLEAEAAELGSTADEQRKTVIRLREELERAAGQAVTEALDELEVHAMERRRAIEEITERLRGREAAIAESIERAESDVRARLDVVLVEWERRQTERLERVTEREIERHTQVAMLAFDERLREAREEAVTRLQRELDRTLERLAREEFTQRLER
jgi:predicted outer membrane lipoprotein